MLDLLGRVMVGKSTVSAIDDLDDPAPVEHTLALGPGCQLSTPVNLDREIHRRACLPRPTCALRYTSGPSTAAASSALHVHTPQQRPACQRELLGGDGGQRSHFSPVEERTTLRNPEQGVVSRSVQHLLPSSPLRSEHVSIARGRNTLLAETVVDVRQQEYEITRSLLEYTAFARA